MTRLCKNCSQQIAPHKRADAMFCNRRCKEACKNKRLNRGTRQKMLRELVLNFLGNECNVCGINNKELQIDHIQPTFMGGENTMENIQLLCFECHIKKSSQEWSLK